MSHAEQILQELPCGCMVFDENGTLSFVNDTLCRLMEYSRSQLQGMHMETMLTIASRIFYQTHFFPMLRLQGEVTEIFLTLRSASGADIPVMVNARATTQDGALVYVGIFSTVYERQKYEEQLLLARKAQQKAIEENEQLNRLTQALERNQHQLDRKLLILKERSQEYIQMGKVLMHDMQEPIRKISYFFEALLGNMPEDQNSEDTKKQEIIRKSILRIRQLTGSLLEFVHFNALKEELTILDSGKLIGEACDLVKKDLQDSDFMLETGLVPGFEGRASLIRRVFSELIKNAVQNRSAERPLVISIKAVLIQENTFQLTNRYKYTDHVKIEVSDNGCGFESRYESYVFGLLNKLNSNSEGMGLGLAMCRQIISHHYGTIRARSVPNEGTTITIVLPLSQTS